MRLPLTCDHGTSMWRHGSQALRVARHASRHPLAESVLWKEYEGLTLLGHREAAFPPIIPHVPCAAQLPRGCDVPPANIVCRAALRSPVESAVQAAVGGHKHGEAGAKHHRKEVLRRPIEGMPRHLGAQGARREWGGRSGPGAPPSPPDRGRAGGPHPPAPSCPR